MNYLSDIEIAQSCTMKPITQSAQTAGVDEMCIRDRGSSKRSSLSFSLQILRISPSIFSMISGVMGKGESRS